MTGKADIMRDLKTWLLTGCAVLATAGTVFAADPPANTKATLIYYDAVSNQTLDPQEPQNNSSFAQGSIMAIFDSLIYLDPTGKPTPGLAQSWAYNADLTEMTLKLRPNVTFHDGPSSTPPPSSATSSAPPRSAPAPAPRPPKR